MRRIHLVMWLLGLLFAFSLSGCVRVRLLIDVKPDGSSELSGAMGMTSQAIALIGTQGVNPMQEITQGLSPDEDQIEVEQWVEGDYEWFGINKSFSKLDDLNQQLSGENSFFQDFSLTKQPGILKDRFVLSATIEPVLGDPDLAENALIDTSGMFEFQFMVRMPGEVVESNGVMNKGEDALAWYGSTDQPVSVRATSEVWNWMNIGIIGGGAGLVMLFLVIGSVLLILDRNKRGKPAQRVGRSEVPITKREEEVKTWLSQPEKAAALEVPPVLVDEDVDAPPMPVLQITPIDLEPVRSLLEQVNQYILKGKGTISESQNEIRLVWQDKLADSGRQAIIIKGVDQDWVSINDRQVPASPEEVKAGLRACLKKMGVLS